MKKVYNVKVTRTDMEGKRYWDEVVKTVYATEDEVNEIVKATKAKITAIPAWWCGYATDYNTGEPDVKADAMNVEGL